MSSETKILVSKGNFIVKPQTVGVIAEVEFETCSGCNRPIASVSTVLFEIEEKHYCVECYYQKITNDAVERDHYDIKPKRG